LTLRSVLSPTRIGAIYVLVVVVIIFSLWTPDLFPRWATFQQIVNTNAISAMAALSLVLPFACGIFDISIPYTMTLSGAFASYGLAHSDWSIPEALLVAIGIGLVVGIVNGLVVVVAQINSLIGTLATGFLIQAFVQWRTSNTIISGSQLTGDFSKIAQNTVGGLTLPVFYALAITIVVWFVLSWTPTGRRLYATGFNKDAARLASVRTSRLQFGALVAASVLAAVSGIVLSSSLGSGSPTAGTSYLLPSFAALFLGATQFLPGRFNAWGTSLAVILLGTITTGLSLAGASGWEQQVATGVVLIAALAVTGMQVRGVRAARRTRRQESDLSPDSSNETQPKNEVRKKEMLVR
jgi:ribose transport system permease protein